MNSPYLTRIVVLVFILGWGWPQLSGCQSAEGKTPITVLNRQAGAQAIVQDTTHHYFDQVSRLDMCLQMKRSFPDSVPDAQVMAAYQSYLRSSVRDFSSEEADRLVEWTEDCLEQVRAIAPSLLPDSLFLIGIDGEAYGAFTFYTRQRGIYIPLLAARSLPESQCKQVLMHELFHIISRYHPQLRQQLYKLIHFQPIDGPVILPSPLRELRLLNPDGIDDHWLMALHPEGYPAVQAQVIIRSRYPRFLPGKPHFFNYLETELYALHRKEGSWTIQGTPAALPQAYWDDFFEKITDNTDYIIHPDEIMADNFVYALMPEAKPELSESGQALRQAVLDVLQTY